MSNVQLNLVTWSLALLPENAEKIDQINRIILGKSSSAQAPIEKAKETVTETSSTKDEGISQADLQTAAKAAKNEHDLDFVKSCIEAVGGEVKRAIGQSLSSIGGDKHDEFLALLKAGPVTEQPSDELEDDGFSDDEDFAEDDDDEAPDVDAVKAALKAYAKGTGREEAKEIMQKHGASALSKVDDCTPAQLTAMFKELV